MLTIELTEEDPGNEDEACLSDEADPEEGGGGGGGEVPCTRRLDISHIYATKFTVLKELRQLAND